MTSCTRSTLLSPDIRRASLAEQSRTLLAQHKHGVLATLLSEQQPYTSALEYALLEDGRIVTLLSELAIHSKNLQNQARCSLLIKSASDSPLNQPRASFLGEMQQINLNDAEQAQYLARHPNAKQYLQLGGFHFYALELERAYTVLGFGRMGWSHASEILEAEPDPLYAVAQGAIEHMNDDHEYNLIDYAKAFAGLDWVENAQMLTLDRYGFDIKAMAAKRSERVRLSFAKPLASANAMRGILVKLAQEAKDILGETDA